MRAIREILHDIISENLLVVADTPFVTEMLAHSPRAVARHVFRTLRRQASEAAIRNIPALLAALTERQDVWRRIVLRSCSRRGRCPKKYRSHLRQVLLHHNIAPQEVELPRLPEDKELLRIRTPPPPLRISRPYFRPPRVVATPASTKITGVEALISALQRCEGRNSIVVEIPDEHIYLPGLVVLEAWRLRHRVTVTIDGSPSTRRYMSAMNFSESSTPAKVQLTAADAPYALALHSIRDETAEALAGRLADICNAHGYVGRETYNALVIAFSELIENVHRHAENPAVATIGAQYYPAQRKLTITLADCGIGIRHSFLRGRNEDAKHRIRNGENALRLAVSPLVTSKPVQSADGIGHSGFGLYIVSELAVRNGGTFRVMSGNDSLTMYRRQVRDNAVRRTEPSNIPFWQGTLISLLLHLDNLLPIGEVYRTLPPPRILEAEEDFFAL